MDRRQFLAASMAGFLPAPAFASPSIVKPKRLTPGDTIGLIAPSTSTWEDEEIRYSIEVIESLDFRVKQGRNLWNRDAYLAGSDQERAADVNAMFGDDSVDGIMALRGGYGAQRTLPFLDYELIARNPKVICGYSDITALLNAIHRKTGLVTFHGPVARMQFSDYTLREFRKVVSSPEPRTHIAAAPPFDARPGKVEFENRLTGIVGGRARGRLVGGNLTILSTLLGSPFQPDFSGKILFIEDVDEAPYRIDRMLTHLWLAGALESCAAVAIGKFTGGDPKSGRSRSIEEILIDRFKPLGIPVVRGLMIGHVSDLTTVPLGVEAELDADAGTLTLLESAVT